jgi:predicted transcriptional regulator
MLGLYALWRVLKWTGLAALLPLYSHISDDEILDDPNRSGIYKLIQTEPGISTKDIADRLDLAWGTVTHHLGKLEKRRFVVSKKYGKYRRYFANGAGGSQDKDALAVLRLDRTGDVAELIRTQPGMTQKAVSQVLGVSSSTILWHVKRLEEVNLVRKVREGKLVRYYPGEALPGITVIPAAPTAA